MRGIKATNEKYSSVVTSQSLSHTKAESTGSNGTRDNSKLASALRLDAAPPNMLFSSNIADVDFHALHR
jgi:hypothetical protein